MIPNELKEDESFPKSEPGRICITDFYRSDQQDQMGPFAKNAMVEYDGKVWSVGGINAYSTPNLSSDVWSSENGKNWISVTNDKFSEREGHTLTVTTIKCGLLVV